MGFNAKFEKKEDKKEVKYALPILVQLQNQGPIKYLSINIQIGILVNLGQKAKKKKKKKKPHKNPTKKTPTTVKTLLTDE